MSSLKRLSHQRSQLPPFCRAGDEPAMAIFPPKSRCHLRAYMIYGFEEVQLFFVCFLLFTTFCLHLQQCFQYPQVLFIFKKSHVFRNVFFLCSENINLNNKSDRQRLHLLNKTSQLRNNLMLVSMRYQKERVSLEAYITDLCVFSSGFYTETVFFPLSIGKSTTNSFQALFPELIVHAAKTQKS